VPDDLQQAQFLLGQRAVGRGNVAGEGIGRLVQLFGQAGIHQRQGGIQAVLVLQKVGATSGDFGEALHVEVPENRQVRDHFADAGQLGVGHLAVGGGDQHHDVNQRGVMVEDGLLGRWSHGRGAFLMQDGRYAGPS